jgi:hypothetical protein
MKLNTRSPDELRNAQIEQLADTLDVPRHAAHQIASYVDPVLNRKAFVRELKDASQVYAAIAPGVHSNNRKSLCSWPISQILAGTRSELRS